MRNYLNNTEYAVKKLIDAINHDSDELIELLGVRNAALKNPGFLQAIGVSTDLNEEFDELRVMNYFAQAHDARMRLDGELKEIDDRIHTVTSNIKAHKDSVAILCGGIVAVC